MALKAVTRFVSWTAADTPLALLLLVVCQPNSVTNVFFGVLAPSYLVSAECTQSSYWRKLLDVTSPAMVI